MSLDTTNDGLQIKIHTKHIQKKYTDIYKKCCRFNYEIISL